MTESSRCFTSSECDGERTCVKGLCQGVARPPKDEFYYYSETQTESGCPNYANDPKMANKDYYCDGKRTCVNGKCQGIARYSDQPIYYFNEGPTGGKCPTSTSSDYRVRNSFCDGLRTCKNGKCQGIARFPKSADYQFDERRYLKVCRSSQWNEVVNDYYCDGKRVCSTDTVYCRGVAR